MKKSLYITSVFSLLLVITGCEFDNYEAPQSILKGKIVYEGTPVNVRSASDMFQLYEPGWETFEPITLNVKQNGTFSARLFDGDYKLVQIEGNGPWVHDSDTIDIHVGGALTSFEVPVEPFFMVRNEAFQLNESILTATFNIEKVVNDAVIKSVQLYIGETMLLDNMDNAARVSINGSAVTDLSDKITLDIDLSGFSKDYVFARIGVETVGNSELVFSPVQKIEL